MDASAGGGGGFCKADGEVQGVDMARAMVKRATGKAVGPDQAADARAVEYLGPGVVVVGGKVVGVSLGVVDLAVRITGMSDAGAEGDRHMVAVDQVADEGLGIFCHVPKAAGVVTPDGLFDPVLVLLLPGSDLPTVATGGAEAHPVRFQHDDGQSLFGQVQCCGKAHVAAADHGHVGPPLALQGGKRVKWRTGRGVVAGGVFAPPVVRVQQVHQTLRSRCSRSHGLMTCRNSLYSFRFTES